MIYVVTVGSYEDYEVSTVLEGVDNLDIHGLYKEFEANILTRIKNTIGNEPIEPKLVDKQVLNVDQLKLWNEIFRTYSEARGKWFQSQIRVLNEVNCELRGVSLTDEQGYHSIYDSFIEYLKVTFGMKELTFKVIEEGGILK